MSDSDLLGVMARNPVRKTVPSKLRPPSPKANVFVPREPASPSPSPPPSPQPEFRSRQDRDRANDAIHPDDSASVVAEAIQRRTRADSPGSVFLDLIKNDYDDGDDGGSLIQSEMGPVNNYGPHGGNYGNYEIKQYADTAFVPAARKVGLPFETVNYPVVPEHRAAEVLAGVRVDQAPVTGSFLSAPSHSAEPFMASVPAGVSDPFTSEMLLEKEKLVTELNVKRAKGFDIPLHLGMGSSIEELRVQLESIRRIENHKRTVALLRYFMVIGCTGVEKATMAFVSDVYLGGWAESIAANQNDYDDVIGRMADTMDLSTAIPPHIELAAMLAVSGVMFHMAKKGKAQLDKSLQRDNVPLAEDRQFNREPQLAHANGGIKELTEEQLRIHALLTGGASETGSGIHLGSTMPNVREPDDDRPGPKKRQKIAIDPDDIVRLF